MPARCEFERALHLLKLALAPDESREPPPRRELEVSSLRPGAHHLVHLHRPVESLYRRRSQRPEFEVALAQSLRHLAGRDRTRRRRSLHPRRQIGHMTDRHVLGMSTNLYRSHHHLARVHPDAGFNRNLALVPQTLGVATQFLLHRQRRMKCALRMVLVRDRRAEQSEDAVAGRLRYVTAIAMHRLHHKVQHRIDDRARLLGIQIAHQLGRALDIGEQRRDGLALAFYQRRSIQLFWRDANLRSR
jgi:hypothetical protein